jgi:hypothetical protein
MRKARLNSVVKHFRNAKSVRCLKTKMVIDVTHNSKFEFHPKERTWTSVGGAITFWNNSGYAEIVTKKKCQCKNCNKPKK